MRLLLGSLQAKAPQTKEISFRLIVAKMNAAQDADRWGK
jgi:hypothetical protein